jgi:hypothetical protein
MLKNLIFGFAGCGLMYSQPAVVCSATPRITKLTAASFERMQTMLVRMKWASVTLSRRSFTSRLE